MCSTSGRAAEPLSLLARMSAATSGTGVPAYRFAHAGYESTPRRHGVWVPAFAGTTLLCFRSLPRRQPLKTRHALGDVVIARLVDGVDRALRGAELRGSGHAANS